MTAAAMRLVALVVLVATSGGQLAELVHRLVVSHEVCAEHGEVVHGDGHGAPRPARPAEGVTIDADAEDDGGHEHCATACATLSPPATVAAAPVVAAAPAFAALTPALPRGPPLAGGVPLLLAAPKTSPPSAC